MSSFWASFRTSVARALGSKEYSPAELQQIEAAKRKGANLESKKVNSTPVVKDDKLKEAYGEKIPLNIARMDYNMAMLNPESMVRAIGKSTSELRDSAKRLDTFFEAVRVNTKVLYDLGHIKEKD